MYVCFRKYKNLPNYTSNDKLWCYEQCNSSFNSELCSLLISKISRSGNYQNLRYKQFSKTTRNGTLLLLCTKYQSLSLLVIVSQCILPNQANSMHTQQLVEQLLGQTCLQAVNTNVQLTSESLMRLTGSSGDRMGRVRETTFLTSTQSKREIQAFRKL